MLLKCVQNTLIIVFYMLVQSDPSEQTTNVIKIKFKKVYFWTLIIDSTSLAVKFYIIGVLIQPMIKKLYSSIPRIGGYEWIPASKAMHWRKFWPFGFPDFF